MKRFLLLLFLSLVIALFCGASSCGDDPPQKPEPPTTKPDTSSHEIEWTEYVFPRTGGQLFDVWAFSPDFVIAVGEVREQVDPRLSQEPNCYIWDGQKWMPKSIPMQWFSGDTTTINWRKSGPPITGIWGFRRDNIWFCSGGGWGNNAYTHLTIAGNDTMIRTEAKSDGDLRGFAHIWAKDTNEIYFAGGRPGSVLRYDGSSFEKLPREEGSPNYFDDILGFASDNIYVSCYESGTPYFYRFDGSVLRKLWGDGDPSLSDSVEFGAPICVWGAKDDDSLWIAGLWLGRMKKDGSGKIRPIGDIRKYGFVRMRGSAKNNFFLVGLDGVIWHYNGATFKEYDNFRGKGYYLNALSIVNNEIFIVGWKYFGGTNALIIHGKMKTLIR